MESLILAAEVVLPLFFAMAVGYFMNLFKICDEKTFAAINKIIFKVFLPALLFYNIYKTDILEVINPGFILFCVLAVICVLIILFIFVPMFEKDNRRRGVIIQGIFRSNFVILGLPVTVSILGEANVGATAVMVAIIVPLFNVLAVLCLEFFRDGEFDKSKILNITKGIITNPLIVSSAIGILFVLLKIKLPTYLEKGVNDISKIATPLALVTLGGTFKFKKLLGNVFKVSVVTLCKLIIVPALVIFVASQFGFKGAPIVTLISMFASPTAVSSFTMAEQMDGDGDLAGQIVVCTTLFSIITIFGFVFVLNNIGMF